MGSSLEGHYPLAVARGSVSALCYPLPAPSRARSKRVPTWANHPGMTTRSLNARGSVSALCYPLPALNRARSKRVPTWANHPGMTTRSLLLAAQCRPDLIHCRLRAAHEVSGSRTGESSGGDHPLAGAHGSVSALCYPLPALNCARSKRVATWANHPGTTTRSLALAVLCRP